MFQSNQNNSQTNTARQLQIEQEMQQLKHQYQGATEDELRKIAEYKVAQQNYNDYKQKTKSGTSRISAQNMAAATGQEKEGYYYYSGGGTGNGKKLMYDPTGKAKEAIANMPKAHNAEWYEANGYTDRDARGNIVLKPGQIPPNDLAKQQYAESWKKIDANSKPVSTSATYKGPAVEEPTPPEGVSLDPAFYKERKQKESYFSQGSSTHDRKTPHELVAQAMDANKSKDAALNIKSKMEGIGAARNLSDTNNSVPSTGIIPAANHDTGLPKSR